MGRLLTLIAALAVLAALCAPGAAAAAGVTNSGDDLRTGWYPDQPSLSPATVSGGSFGQLWSANVSGQVYAQPLLDAGTLLVATEANQVYGLDPATGGQRWNTPLGTPWRASDLGCGDLTPTVGVTATPVIDKATDTAYLTSKTYAHGTSGAARWELHALDMTTGQERSGFPVVLQGAAQNAPSRTFDPTHEMQRPGLLLLDGVVYAAFGSHCDISPWQGWIFGVSTAGATTARWVAAATGDGAGIWQSGSGLMSDGPGQIVVGTGNPGAPSAPAPGTSPPGNLGESIVRLHVRPDGSLAPVDFFAPFDAANLDLWDADFASAGPVALPDAYFGTAAVPHLLVAVGKEGYVYLLDRDHLGGIGQGPNGSDAVVQRIGPAGGVWSRPAVWPGDGGYVFLPTASAGQSGGSSSGTLDVYAYGTTGAGKPALSLAGRSSDAFGFSSSAPVITSDGTTSGSALVWTVWTASGSGQGAQLRAYDPVPVSGRPVLRWSAPIGTSAKFAMPGVGANRLYVGTRDGTVRAFGSPVTPPVAAPSSIGFPATIDGSSTTRTLTLSANDAVTVSGIDHTGGSFATGTPSQSLPATLGAGETLSVPVTFSPAASGPAAGTVTVHTNKGDVAVGLSGTGEAAGPELTLSPVAVSFGGAPVGGHESGTATLRNTGSQDLVVSAVTPPAAPFGVSGAPAPGAHVAPGAAVTMTVTFDPAVGGTWTDALSFTTNGGNGEVGLSGTAGTPGHLDVTAGPLDFGSVALGASGTRSLSIANTGEAAVTVTKSKPPSGGEFAALDALAEGTVIPGGETRTLRVRFTPTASGPATGTWQITGNDSTGLHTVDFTGSGTAPPPGPSPTPSATPIIVPEPPVTEPAPMPAPWPMGWWDFDEPPAPRVRDLSSHGHGGRLHGARRVAATGRGGDALRLAGRGDRMTVASAVSLGLRHAFTLEARVRPARVAAGRAPLLSARRAFALDAGTSGRGPAIEARAGGVTHVARGPHRLRAHRWTQLAATWDGHVLRIYVDGRRVASRQLAGRLAVPEGPLVLGGGFAGLADDVRVYATALTPVQVAADRGG